jgi:hypothetical protein
VTDINKECPAIGLIEPSDELVKRAIRNTQWPGKTPLIYKTVDPQLVHGLVEKVVADCIGEDTDGGQATLAAPLDEIPREDSAVAIDDAYDLALVGL